MTNSEESKRQDITDISIQILDMLVHYGFIQDCFNTDDDTEFFVQDKINEILIKNQNKLW
jgi:ribosomal protein S8